MNVRPFADFNEAQRTKKLTIRCTRFQPVTRNSLRGFAVIHIAEMRMTIRDVAIHAMGASRWAQPPARPLLDHHGVALRNEDTGKIAYSQLIEFDDDAVRKAWSEAVIKAVIEHDCTAFGEEAA